MNSHGVLHLRFLHTQTMLQPGFPKTTDPQKPGLPQIKRLRRNHIQLWYDPSTHPVGPETTALITAYLRSLLFPDFLWMPIPIHLNPANDRTLAEQTQALMQVSLPSFLAWPSPSPSSQTLDICHEFF